MIVEVDLVDESTGETVEHGTCTIEIERGLVHAHSFRSSAEPDKPWLLPPGHSFTITTDVAGLLRESDNPEPDRRSNP